jgi:hypothetical protein
VRQYWQAPARKTQAHVARSKKAAGGCGQQKKHAGEWEMKAGEQAGLHKQARCV